jgi:hypothetical protein
MKKIAQVRGEAGHTILGLMKAVATDEGKLPMHEIHESTLQALANHLFHQEVDPSKLEANFSAYDRIEDPELQKEVLHMGGIFPYLEEETVEQKASALVRLGELWGVRDNVVKGTLALCKGHKRLLYMDTLRMNKYEFGSTARTTLKFLLGPLHLDGSKKILEQYHGYAELPDHTLGRTMVQYYQDNEFPLPGTPGATFSNALTQHDFHHVMAGYDTTPLGEILVQAFDHAISQGDASGAIVGVVAQMQIGLVFDPSVRAWKGQFNPDLFFRAIERGNDAKVDYLTPGYDMDPLMEEPLDEIRERFGIAPEGRLVNGPDDRWCGEMGPVTERESSDIVKQKGLNFD